MPGNNEPALQQDQTQPPVRHIERVAVKTPPFWKAEPKLWFIQLEAQFDLSGVTADTTKYNYVVSAIDTSILTQIADFVTTPPATDKYPGIKNRLITIFSESSEKKLRKLLSEITLGDQKPSQLLNEMSRLGGSAVPQDMLKTLWMQHLPTQIQSVLTASNDTLDNLAQMADKIAEIEQPRVFAVEQSREDLVGIIKNLEKKVEELQRERSRPNQSNYHRRHRSRTPGPRPSASEETGFCWYHQNFSAKARKCIPPCTYSNLENETPRS